MAGKNRGTVAIVAPPDRQAGHRLRAAIPSVSLVGASAEPPAVDGAVAQLGERGVRNAEVGSSILLRSTDCWFWSSV